MLLVNILLGVTGISLLKPFSMVICDRRQSRGKRLRYVVFALAGLVFILLLNRAYFFDMIDFHHAPFGFTANVWKEGSCRIIGCREPLVGDLPSNVSLDTVLADAIASFTPGETRSDRRVKDALAAAQRAPRSAWATGTERSIAALQRALQIVDIENHGFAAPSLANFPVAIVASGTDDYNQQMAAAYTRLARQRDILVSSNDFGAVLTIGLDDLTTRVRSDGSLQWSATLQVSWQWVWNGRSYAAQPLSSVSTSEIGSAGADPRERLFQKLAEMSLGNPAP